VVGWDAPIENHGAEVTQYIIELKAPASGWDSPDLEETFLVADANATAAAVDVGGKHGIPKSSMKSIIQSATAVLSSIVFLRVLANKYPVYFIPERGSSLD